MSSDSDWAYLSHEEGDRDQTPERDTDRPESGGNILDEKILLELQLLRWQRSHRSAFVLGSTWIADEPFALERKPFLRGLRLLLSDDDADEAKFERRLQNCMRARHAVELRLGDRVFVGRDRRVAGCLAWIETKTIVGTEMQSRWILCNTRKQTTILDLVRGESPVNERLRLENGLPGDALTSPPPPN